MNQNFYTKRQLFDTLKFIFCQISLPLVEMKFSDKVVMLLLYSDYKPFVSINDLF